MKDWIRLDPIELNPGEITDIQGIEVRMALSPYDVPDAVRGGYNEKSKRFVIQFEYLTDEKKDLRKTGDEHIQVKVGKNSERIYEIEINTKALDVHMVSLVLTVLDEMASHQNERRRGHYELLHRVIEDKKAELVATA